MLVGYFGYHFIKGFFAKSESEPVVKGKQSDRSLDLEEDIEDAKFRDVEEK